VLIYRIILSALDGVKKDLGGLLNTLEEAVILSASCSCLLVWMMAQDLLSVGALDLLFRGLIAVLREAENSIMILAL
jgi:hypothetical protein